MDLSTVGLAKILVIDDEEDLLAVLEHNLTQAGHQVATAELGERGLNAVPRFMPELIILDLMLPDIRGTEVLKRIRQDSSSKGIPVLLLSARGEEIDRVLGFELGADDYLVKPFSIRELVLRVAAILKRTSEPASPDDIVTFGSLKLDGAAHRAWVEDQEIELTSLEFKLLMKLWKRKNRVQTREKLLDEVWGIQADVTTRTVDTHVKRLREKLGKAGTYIETVRGVGYRFSDSPES